MISAGAFTVFALGLRHGADPDHLAAIDNMTRNSVERQPLLSRFIGSLFAGGHTIMVFAIAALLGFLGSRFTAAHETIENTGTLVSAAALLFIAALNLRQLANGETDRVAGAKFRLIPRFLRTATSPWVAVPVGVEPVAVGVDVDVADVVAEIYAHEVIRQVGPGVRDPRAEGPGPDVEREPAAVEVGEPSEELTNRKVGRCRGTFLHSLPLARGRGCVKGINEIRFPTHHPFGYILRLGGGRHG